MLKTARALLAALALAGAPALHAQQAVATAPTTTAPRADTTTTQFEVNGLPVILRRNTANDVVAANLYLLGGTRQTTPETAGIERFLLATAERGTRRFPGQRSQQTLVRLGSTIAVDASQDWTEVGLMSIRSAFDSSWAVLADRVMAPTLDSSEVELIRAQLLAGAREARTSPDAQATALADSLTFPNHPYAADPDGTERSLSRITRAELRTYLRDQMVTSRMLLVVVGNVDRPTVERLVRGTLATLPRGSYHWTPPAAPSAHPADAVIVARSLPTNYILGYYVGPPASSKDYVALRVASAVLAGSLFTEVRARRKLSYAADAPFVERAVATGGVYVTTVYSDTTLKVMQAALDELKSETLQDESLARLVQRFITDYYLHNETNHDQATQLARAALYRGDYREALRFVDELHQVTPQDVQRVARTYMKDFHFAYVGNPAQVQRGLLEGFGR